MSGLLKICSLLFLQLSCSIKVESIQIGDQKDRMMTVKSDTSVHPSYYDALSAFNKLKNESLTPGLKKDDAIDYMPYNLFKMHPKIRSSEHLPYVVVSILRSRDNVILYYLFRSTRDQRSFNLSSVWLIDQNGNRHILR